MMIATASTPLFSDPVAIALIGMIGTFLTAMLSAFTAYTGRQNNKSIESQKSAMDELAANTNSIKDALVKKTGEAEFAKGLKQGAEDAKS